jgi:DNA-binding beta-propeller fold protein YncE
MKFWISVFGVFLVAHTASASYELLLVADTVNKSIRRFDPQSHAYFGSFGDDILQNPIGLAVDPSLGVCYVAEASSFLIHVYNYSTGEYIRGLTIGASSPGPRLSLDSSGNLIFVGNNSGAYTTR